MFLWGFPKGLVGIYLIFSLLPLECTTRMGSLLTRIHLAYSCPSIQLAYLCPVQWTVSTYRAPTFSTWPPLHCTCLGAPGCVELAAKDNCQLGCVGFFSPTSCNNCIQTTLQCAIKIWLERPKVGCGQAGRVSIASQPSCSATPSYKQQQTKKRNGHKKLN